MTQFLTGIHKYEETDDAPTFSDLLNLGMQSVSLAKGYFRGTAAEREALDPAPSGALWQTLDDDEGLYSCSPTGTWRLHEGVSVFSSGAFAANGPLWTRDIPVVLPTVISADETITVSSAPSGSVISAWLIVNQVTRGPSSTTVTIRQFALGATAQPGAFAWRIVKKMS